MANQQPLKCSWLGRASSCQYTQSPSIAYHLLLSHFTNAQTRPTPALLWLSPHDPTCRITHAREQHPESVCLPSLHSAGQLCMSFSQTVELNLSLWRVEGDPYTFWGFICHNVSPPDWDDRYPKLDVKESTLTPEMENKQTQNLQLSRAQRMWPGGTYLKLMSTRHESGVWTAESQHLGKQPTKIPKSMREDVPFFHICEAHRHCMPGGARWRRLLDSWADWWEGCVLTMRLSTVKVQPECGFKK